MQSDHPIQADYQSPPDRLAGFFCLLGFFLHIILSEPLLNSLGFHYSGDSGKFYEKIHPGSICIIAAFLILLCRSKNPIYEWGLLFIRHRTYSILLATYLLLFCYMLLRSGPQGLAFIIDTHMVVPMAALVLCYTPARWCCIAIHCFIILAVLNSMTGIAEAMGKFRIFTYDSSWSVLKETYFRSSAFLGHPLNNAMFTSIALFIAMALRYPFWLKGLLAIIFIISLVAFGGRAGLAFSTGGLLLFVFIEVRKLFSRSDVTLLQVWIYLIAAMVLPLLLSAGLYIIIDSYIGERIATHLWWDNSAQSRFIAFQVFHYMGAEEIFFGVSPARIMHINDQINLTTSLSDIENPWLLMLMNLGVMGFGVWLAATLAFIYALLNKKPVALKLAVLCYFIIASTSNSFGRKDSIYVIMVIAVLCAYHAFKLKFKTQASSC